MLVFLVCLALLVYFCSSGVFAFCYMLYVLVWFGVGVLVCSLCYGMSGMIGIVGMCCVCLVCLYVCMF